MGFRDRRTDATTTTVDGTRSIPRPRRKLYVASLVAAFVVTVVFSLVARGVDRVFTQGGLKDVPFVTDLALWVGRVLRDPLWMGVVVFGVVFLVLLGLKGLLDRILKLLIGLNFLWLVIFLLMSLSTWLAFLKVAERMKPAGG